MYKIIFILLLVPVFCYAALDEQIVTVSDQVTKLYGECGSGVKKYQQRYQSFEKSFSKMVYKLQLEEDDLFQKDNVIVDVVYYLYPHTRIIKPQDAIEMNECIVSEKDFVDSCLKGDSKAVREKHYQAWHQCLDSFFRKDMPSLIKKQIECFQNFK